MNSVIKVYMNIGNSHWHIWDIDCTKTRYFTLFQFVTRLLTSKHLKHSSTYLVGQNTVKWKTCFSAPQNAKKEHQLKHKNRVRNWRFIELGLRVWKIMLVISKWTKKKKSNVYLHFNENIENLKGFNFTLNRVFKHKGVVSNELVCTNEPWKLWVSYIFHFSIIIKISTLWK